jgi:RNA polymerase sigma-70 factor (sigma-E family)
MAPAVNPGAPVGVWARVTGTLALYDSAGPTIGTVTRVEAPDADDALTALYAAHYRRLVRIAALLLDDYSLSEEVVQDAYVKMHGSWRRIREPEAAEAYLRTTVLNLARSRLRRRMVAAKHAPKPLPDAPSAEHGALEQLERDRVIRALHSLPPRQRECLVLRYYADMSEAQIAEAMGISAGAVKSHASRGMGALRTALLEERP